jgi:hypothetical protein
MATTPTPQPEQGQPDPVAQFRAYLQAQQQGQQMGPSMTHSQAQVQPQAREQTDRAATQGFGKRQSMRDFGSAVQNLVGQVTQKVQQRKATEQQHLFDRFTQSVQGIQEAQTEVQQAQEAVKQNPQDQAAVARLQKAQGAINQNKTILDAMFNGPHGEKNAKLLSKGFGIDDKNKDTPERQSAIKAMQKAMGGIGDKPAGILAQLPQTSQQTPGTQPIKPPTGNAMLQSADKAAGRQQQMAIEQLKQAGQQGVSLDKLKMIGTMKGVDVTRDATTGQIVTHILTPEERAKVPYLKAQDEASAAKTEAERAMADAKTNPNNPEMKVRMMDAQANAVRAQAMTQIAQADMMKAMAVQAKEPPEVMQARKTVDKLNQDLAKTQLAMSQQNSGFFGGGKYDPDKAQVAVDTLQKNIKASQGVIDKYTAQKEKEAGTDEPIVVTEEDMK